uniref:hypothetical protein n=1 Tax=Klebsiella pneumoniae TaxID=573 RepID=UPI001F4B2043
FLFSFLVFSLSLLLFASSFFLFLLSTLVPPVLPLSLLWAASDVSQRQPWAAASGALSFLSGLDSRR